MINSMSDNFWVKRKNNMAKFYTILDKCLSAILIILVICMVISITMEIFLREVAGQILGNPGWISDLSSPVNTASQTLLVWIGILGSSMALRYRAHLGIDVFINLYPKKLHIVLDYISTVLIALFSLFVLLYGGFMICHRAISSGSLTPGFENINRAWFYSVLVIAGILNLIYCIYLFMHPLSASEEKISDN